MYVVIMQVLLSSSLVVVLNKLLHSIRKQTERESRAISKKTARCAVHVCMGALKMLGLPDYGH